MACGNILNKFFGYIIPCRKKSDRVTIRTSNSTAAQIHKFNIMWTVDDFDLHVMKKKIIKSDEFSATTDEEFAWYLAFEPSDRVAKRVDDLATYFNVYYTGGEALAKINVSILDSRQKQIIQKSFAMREFSNKKTFHIFIDKKLISPRNRLTICCDLTYTKYDNFVDIDNRYDTPAEPSAPPLQLDIPESDHAGKIASLYNDATFADITLSVKDKNYAAHKAILAAHSPVFASMFEANAKKGKVACVNISGIDEQVLGEMLRYIYTGRCENLDNLARDLLTAADRYGLDRLKIICADILCKKLSVENAADVLVLADKRGLNQLKSEVIKFITAKYIEIANEETWRNAIKKKPQLVHEVNQELCRLSLAGYSNNGKT